MKLTLQKVANVLLKYPATKDDDKQLCVYYWQMQLGMIAANLDKGFFVSYDPRMPEGKQLHIAEIERHDLQFEIDEKLEAAWELLQTILHS